MHFRFAMMYSLSSLAGAFSGLIAYGIRNLNGKHGIAGWQWIFIVVRGVSSRKFSISSDNVAQEGTFTVAFGLATLFVVPASPKNFKLLTEEERETYCRDLADDWSGDADTDGTYQEVFSYSEVTSAFLDAPHVLMTFVALFFDGTMVRPRSIVLLSLQSLIIRSLLDIWSCQLVYIPGILSTSFTTDSFDT